MEKFEENFKRVVVIDDNDDWQIFMQYVLSAYGHSVIATARSMDEAWEVIDKLEKENNENLVAVVDGNLSPRVHSGEDGTKIALHIREKLAHVAIVGCSNGEEFEGVDHFMPKSIALAHLPKFLATF